MMNNYLQSPPDSVVKRFLNSPDPKMGLINLERLAEAVISRQGFYELLEEYPDTCDLLVGILSVSQFLTDVLIRNPEYIYWIAENPRFFDTPVSKASLQERLTAEVHVFAQLEYRIEALRRLQRRELLRIGIGEASGRKDIDTVGEELSDLADVIIGLLLIELQEEMTARYGLPITDRDREIGRFTIIGLGKLGGRELNFSSDIDLIFVYSSEGMTQGGDGVFQRSISNYEFFHRLSERFVGEATKMTSEGFLYRVDTRLRPEGRSGPLARSLTSYEYYYEARGEIWERQMLIKARPVAGDESLGEAFLTTVEPFIYPAVFTESPSVEVRKIKEKIEAKIRKKEQTYSHLKLRPGGIRDVEFIVQTLQLLAGRQFPNVRDDNTVRAIDALRTHGTLSEEEAVSLREGYRFLRRVEHRLQTMNARESYVLPDDPEEIERLAIMLRFAGRGELIDRLNRTFSSIRKTYDDIFRDSEEDGEVTVEMIASMEMDDPRALTLLKGWGFSDPVAAQRYIVALSTGGGTTIKDLAIEERFRRILRPLLRRISTSADPDQTLGQFGRIIAAYGATEILYDLLSENEAFFDLIVSLCARSQFLVDLVVHDPSLLDWLVSPGAIEVERDSLGMEEALCDMIRTGWEYPLYAFKNRELLRIGCRDILRLASTEPTCREISFLADTILKDVYREHREEMIERYGSPVRSDGGEAQFVSVALGKLGGMELNFGSDLDLLFVYDGDGRTAGRPGTDNLSFFTELSSRMMSHLTATTQHGVLYRVDARLRPEGGNAPLVMPLARYFSYLGERASTWERLAYLRARTIVGDDDLGERFLRRVEAFVFNGPSGRGFFEEVITMRKRIETHARQKYRGTISIKSGTGGIVDVEFLASALQIRYGIRTASTIAGIERLVEQGALREEEHRILREGYLFLRTIEKTLRIVNEQAASALPKDPRQQLWLARALGYADPTLFTTDLRGTMGRIRAVFTSVMKRYIE